MKTMKTNLLCALSVCVLCAFSACRSPLAQLPNNTLADDPSKVLLRLSAQNDLDNAEEKLFGRTVWVIDEPSPSSWLLEGKLNGGSVQTLGSFSVLEGESIAIERGVWDFTLTAKGGLDEVLLQGNSLNYTIDETSTLLAFQMRPTGIGVGDIAITVNWTNPSVVTEVIRAEYYFVAGNQPASIGSPVLNNTLTPGVTTDSYTATNLSPGEHTWVIKLYSSATEPVYVWPEVVRVFGGLTTRKIIDVSASEINKEPLACSNLAITLIPNTSDPTNVQVTFTWENADTFLESYTGEYSEDSGTTWIPLTETLVPGVFSANQSVMRGANCSFRIKALNSYGESAESVSTSVPIPWLLTYDFQDSGVTPNAYFEIISGNTYGSFPGVPPRPGYTFSGWFTGMNGAGLPVNVSDPVTANTILYAYWTSTPSYTLSFDPTYYGTPISEKTLDSGVSYSLSTLTTDGFLDSMLYTLDGWSTTQGAPTPEYLTTDSISITANTTLYPVLTWAADINNSMLASYKTMVSMDQAPGESITYLQQTSDNITGFTHNLSPYYIAANEVPYMLWYTVLQEATVNGYTIANPGREGSSGTPGALPTPSGKFQPVTDIAWPDAVAWCNLYSELDSRVPVYMLGGSKYTDSSLAGWENMLCDWGATGYRLPSEGEWQYAASADGLVLYTQASGSEVGGYAIADYSVFNTSTTADTKSKSANSFNLYDMSGNVAEWCWDGSGGTDPVSTGVNWRGMDGSTTRAVRGGSYTSTTVTDSPLYVGTRSYDLGATPATDRGFRVASSLPRVKKISASDSHLLVLMSDGSIFASGFNTNGQFGANSTDSAWNNALVQVSSLSGIPIADITAGNGVSMFLGADGTMYVCGNNSVGQLGLNSAGGDQLTAVIVPPPTGGGTWTKMYSGGTTSYAITSDGDVYATGNNTSGQFGRGDTAGSSVFESVYSSEAVEMLAVGDNHALLLTTSGVVYGTGQEDNSELGGIGNTYVWTSSIPSAVIQIDTTPTYSWALLSDGSLKASGSDTYGQISNNQSSLNGFTDISFSGPIIKQLDGSAYFSLAVTQDGLLYTTGCVTWSPYYGQLGLGPSETDTASVFTQATVTLPLLDSVAAGANTSYLLARDGTLWMLGSDGTPTGIDVPLRIK